MRRGQARGWRGRVQGAAVSRCSCPRRSKTTAPPRLTRPLAADTLNECSLDGIASPDNVNYIPELDTLLIAEVRACCA